MKLTKYFEEATDFRVKGRCLHDLSEILFLVLLGTLCDCDDFLEIRDWGNDELPFLRNDLGLKYSNGIPSEDTLERVMKHLNPKELEVVMRKTASEIVGFYRESNSVWMGKNIVGQYQVDKSML